MARELDFGDGWELDFGGWLGNWTLGMARELDFGGWLGNWTLGDG